ncbi:ABC transporter permease [Paenibacillus graminis]|uniref:ABC3 transporter permease C-terminal domain-containing protein n=1 Tax=Paenibacillus graminis TaxID=189425 RepID=A0A089MF41_9BACL|nr:FtsX-like permease family protein [Paenibacillus graminis]AIQ70990.1 hypothetical protein PGRAT_27790 [Paenibacillus graminis]
MLSTNNRKTISFLAKKSLKSNLSRNLAVISAIVLTTLLITAVLTMTLSINKSIELAAMKTSGSDYHGSFKYLNSTELKKLQSHPSIKEYGSSLTVGEISTPVFKNNRVEVLRIDKNNAKHSFIQFIEGGLPIKENEIVLNTWALEKLGAQHKLGQVVKLDIDTGEKTITQDFIISGYYEADKNLAMSGLAFVSEAFTKKYISQINPEISKEKGSYVNTSQLNIMFDNSFNIEKKLNKILTDTGLNVPYGVNPAYTSASLFEDLMNIIPFAVVILITMLSGYLLIYNIFYISVVRDVKFYGLLKTIGTTPRQLKRLISIQARWLYIIALPFGMALGFLLGLLVVPMISSLSSAPSNIAYSNSPWIFIGAAIFSYITVWIASNKPGRMASQISPVEAVKFSEVSGLGKKKSKKSKHGAKLATMAFSNVFRNKKKLILMLSSLSLSVVLFSTIFTIISSLDVNKYLGSFIAGDLMVQNEVLVSISGERAGDPYKLSEELSNTLSKIDGVKSADKVYYRYELKPFDDPIRSILTPLALGASGDSDIASTMNRGVIPIDLYGVDSGWYSLVNKDITEGKFNKEQFDSGKYILVSNAYFRDDSKKNTYYHPGDNISFPDLGKSFEVMALVNSDALYAATTKHYSLFGFNAFLPASELQKELPVGSDPAKIVSVTLDTDPTKLDSVEKTAKTLTDATDELTLKSRDDYKAELRGFIHIFQNIGYGLSLVIALIGVLNYINTVLTGVISRRNEFAVLESIGMTKKQLKLMLVYEGLYNVLLTLLITSTLGVLVTYNISKSISAVIEFTVFHMKWQPFVIIIPILAGTVCIVTMYAYRFLAKSTIVERLRQLE